MLHAHVMLTYSHLLSHSSVKCIRYTELRSYQTLPSPRSITISYGAAHTSRPALAACAGCLSCPRRHAASTATASPGLAILAARSVRLDLKLAHLITKVVGQLVWSEEAPLALVDAIEREAAHGHAM